MKKSAILFCIIFLSAALGFAVTSDKKTVNGIEYFEEKKGDSVVGYSIELSFKGYSGLIRALVRIDTNGVIHDIEILENNETPGFGTRIDKKNFLGQFKDKDADTVAVGKNIDAVTGATISSKAITDAIQKTTGEFFKKLRK